jgi:hypothetical protein
MRKTILRGHVNGFSLLNSVAKALTNTLEAYAIPKQVVSNVGLLHLFHARLEDYVKDCQPMNVLQV